MNVTFDSKNVKTTTTFGLGLTSRKVEVPASDFDFVALMTFDRIRDDEPSDADRLEWYSNGESVALEIEAGAFEASVALESGYFHA